MSKLSDIHNIQLTNAEIIVLSTVLENIDVKLELELKGGIKISLSNTVKTVLQKLNEIESDE